MLKSISFCLTLLTFIYFSTKNMGLKLKIFNIFIEYENLKEL